MRKTVAISEFETISFVIEVMKGGAPSKTHSPATPPLRLRAQPAGRGAASPFRFPVPASVLIRVHVHKP
jgi:hypothetical protein